MKNGPHPQVNSNTVSDVAKQRRAALFRYRLLKRRHGGARAAAMAGASVPTLWRWEQRFARHGLRGLNSHFGNCGRRSKFAAVRLPAAALHELQRRIAETGRPRAAWLAVSRRADCPPLLARYLQQHGGKAPAALAALGRLRPVQALVFVSPDGRSCFVRVPGKSAVSARLTVIPNFRPKVLTSHNQPTKHKKP